MTTQFDKILFRLYRYRPRFDDWRFWIVQFSAIGIAILHALTLEADAISTLNRLSFVPLSLMVIPIVIAGIIFGSVGSVTTSIWVIIICLPSLIMEQPRAEFYGESFQLLILVAIGIFIGKRVDLERSLLRKVEAASTALSASEARYRSLFDASPIAILTFDNNNNILDANPAAGRLFNAPPEELKKLPIKSLENQTSQENPHSDPAKQFWWESTRIIHSRNGELVYLEPAMTQIKDQDGNIITQLLLKDITDEYKREAGLKAYAAHIVQAQEDERQHIARELHDDTIQNLALLCRQLDSIGSSEKGMPSTTVEELRKARRIAENVMGQLRNFTRALRPPILDDLGIVAPIRRLLLDFMERASAKGELQVTGNERRLTRDVEVGIFRIAQEALWNVEKHAHASSVLVRISFDPENVKLIVQDDGAGFSVPATIEGLTTAGKLGLLGMKERASLMGGSLNLTSGKQGTTVSLSVPEPVTTTPTTVSSA